MYPELLDGQPDLKNKVQLKSVLQGLLLGCTARSFMGSGFNATEGSWKAGFDEEYIGQAEEVLAILDNCNTSLK